MIIIGQQPDGEWAVLAIRDVEGKEQVRVQFGIVSDVLADVLYALETDGFYEEGDRGRVDDALYDADTARSNWRSVVRTVEQTVPTCLLHVPRAWVAEATRD